MRQHNAPQDHASGLPFIFTVQQEPKAIQALVDFVALISDQIHEAITC